MRNTTQMRMPRKAAATHATDKKASKNREIRNEREKQILADYIAGKPLPNEDAGSFWEKVPSTGGGLRSTTSDLIRFANMTLNGGCLDNARILGRKTIEVMTTQQLKNVPDYCWGSNEPDRKYGAMLRPLITLQLPTR